MASERTGCSLSREELEVSLLNHQNIRHMFRTENRLEVLSRAEKNAAVLAKQTHGRLQRNTTKLAWLL
jgi:hypothetical protein